MRTLVAAAYVVATAFRWATMLVQDPTRIGLPSNPLLVADEPDLFSTLSKARLVVVAALIAALGMLLVRRWGRASHAQRLALALVYLSGGLVLALYAVWSVLNVVGPTRICWRTSSARG